MLNIRGVKVYTQDELLDKLALYIIENIGVSDQSDHIYMVSGYVGAMIGENEVYVREYLKKALRLNP